MGPTDIMQDQILKLETLRDLLMTNDKSMQLDPHGISSLMDGILEGLKFSYDGIMEKWNVSLEE